MIRKDNISLTDRGNFSNSIFGEEKKVSSFNNSKLQSIKAEKIKKNITNLSNYKKRNIFKNIKNIQKKENISMNISKNNFLNKKNKKDRKKLIDLNKKCPNFSFNKYKKNIYISTNINYKKVKFYKKDNILTDNKNDQIVPKFNKNKFLDSTHFSMNINNKNKISQNNNSINKYKELINEFNPGSSENKNLNSFSKLEKDYFNSYKKYGPKNRNKNYIFNQTHFISKTNTLNSISKIINNDNNIEDISKINQKLFKNSVKNKKNLDVNNNVKYKLFHTYKYKKNNLNIDIDSLNYKIKDNIIGLITSKIKNKKNINYTQRNNFSFKKYYNNFMRTSKNKSGNKRTKNPFSQNISMSYQNSNKNIKNINNNKKFINININNILKIDKKFSINLTKSTETTNNNINNNNDAVKKENKVTYIKNYNSSYPLKNNKNYKYKGSIKYYTTSRNKNELIHPKMRNEQKTNRNFSSLLKKQFLEEQIFNKNF